MKMKLTAIITCLVLLGIAGFAQTPPTPPQPPGPGHPPGPPSDHEKAPKVPTIFLGVETSQVPTVVSEQLGLSKGLGLVVEYVVPDSPAAAAGVQQNDILKMLNDQIPAQWPRAMFWICMMNGAAGHTYGANGIWQVNRRGERGELLLDRVRDSLDLLVEEVDVGEDRADQQRVQRFESPSTYLAKQREAAERTQRANDQAATDKVAEAVDSLSSKQIEEFIAVETAIATGETITAHGSSASYLERAQQERRQFLKKAEAEGRPLVLDDPRAALNPGMHPQVYKRRRRSA